MKLLNSLLLCCLLLLATPLQAKRAVYVAAYDFPPYFSNALKTDMTSELVAVLNQHQNTYQFIIQVVPPNGRYQALAAEGCCDVILFESPVWGWDEQTHQVQSTRPLLRGRERLVAKKVPGRGQEFFQNLQNKVLGGVNGYHYLMSGTVMNSAEVAEKYRIYLADSRITNVRMLIGGRIDAAVLNDGLLYALKNSSVDYLDQLLVSEDIEHEYSLSAIVADNKNIRAATMQQLLRELQRQGELAELFRRFNVQRMQLSSP